MLHLHRSVLYASLPSDQSDRCVCRIQQKSDVDHEDRAYNMTHEDSVNNTKLTDDMEPIDDTKTKDGMKAMDDQKKKKPSDGRLKAGSSTEVRNVHQVICTGKNQMVRKYIHSIHQRNVSLLS